MVKSVALFTLLTALTCRADAASSMSLKINGELVAVEWKDSNTVKALNDLLPLTIEMHRYGSFEQVGSLAQTLPCDDKRITTSPGDIVLYAGDQVVIFYGSNTWAYTRLGRITDKTPAQLSDMLGNSDAVVSLSAE